ncbi:MAG: hypothetical protein ACM3OC_08635 [Deltaproteobacteria bacterium]
MKRAAAFAGGVIVLVSSVRVLAAPVSVPAGIANRGPNYIINDRIRREYQWSKDTDLVASFEGSGVLRRDLDKPGGRAEGNFVDARFGVSCFDTVEVYTLLGSSSGLKYRAGVAGSTVEYRLEDKLLWGAGGNWVIYEHPKPKIALFTDVDYRQLPGMRFDSVTVNGTQFTGSSITTVSKARWHEWQAALGLAWVMAAVKPYAGGVYSSVRVSAKANVEGKAYDAGHASGDKTLGCFAGLIVGPFRGISLEVQGRFIDEEAIAGAFNIKF